MMGEPYELTRYIERVAVVAYLRRVAQRVERKSASANNLNAVADAIESGEAFGLDYARSIKVPDGWRKP